MKMLLKKIYLPLCVLQLLQFSEPAGIVSGDANIRRTLVAALREGSFSFFILWIT